MCKNKRFIGVVVIVTCTGLMNAVAGDAARAPIEFEGRFDLHGPLNVGIAAGSADYPELVLIESVSFNTSYSYAWGVTACVGWLPVKEATWRLTVELLDEEGRILRHSGDDPMVFTCKAGKPDQTEMQYADLYLSAMRYQGRRHAARFRIRLEPSENPVTSRDTHTLEVVVVNQESRKPISDAAVVVSTSYLPDTFQTRNTLYSTDSQGRCRINLVRDGLTVINVNAQKQGYCTIQKSWSNSGPWADRAPLAILPERHVLEMVRVTTVGGIVRDVESNAIKGAIVHLEAQMEEPSGVVNINRTVRTNADGRWRVEGIPREVERITLRIRHPGYGGNNGRNRRISGEAILNARSFKHVETLEKGMTIMGKVLDDRGQPVAGATVMLTQWLYNAVCVLTDASGVFRLVCSSDPSDYREAPVIVVEAPGYAPVQRAINLQSSSEALEFRLQRGRTITCRVVDTKGQPVAGAWTVAKPFPDNRSYSVWLEPTNDRGEFQVPNAPQGNVTLTIGKQGYGPIRDHEVPASEEDVVLTMKRTMSIHGTVTDAKTGEPVPHFEIAEVYESGGRTRTSDPVAFAEGKYKVSINEMQPDPQQFKVSAVGYEPTTSDQIKMHEGERAIDFKLTRSTSFNEATGGRPREQARPTGPRRITGMVRDEQGKPVPDAIIRTCPSMGEEVVTNAKGTFTFKLRINEMREEMTYLLVRQKERNLGVAVELDTSMDTVNVTLAPGTILSGKVIDVEGKVIPSAELSLTFWTSSIGYSNRELTEIDKAGHYEIRAVPPGHKYSVNASAKGYGTRYVQVNTGGAANERIEVEPLVLSVANLSASGIVVDDFGQPVSGIRISAYGNGQPSRETFTDEKGQFTIENICPGPLSIQANSQRQAPRRFRGRARVEGGATDIKVVVEELDERGRPVPSQPPSLVGKPLPELKDVGINLSPDDIEGKKILVCFWDMQQRPSRNCLRQLSIRAQELKAKDVVVVAIQASKIDENTLKKWVKENNIPFPVGTIQADEEKTRFDWGVKSLPRLILTDREHIVQAEGFSIGDLDQKLKHISQE